MIFKHLNWFALAAVKLIFLIAVQFRSELLDPKLQAALLLIALGSMLIGVAQGQRGMMRLRKERDDANLQRNLENRKAASHGNDFREFVFNYLTGLLSECREFGATDHDLEMIQTLVTHLE